MTRAVLIAWCLSIAALWASTSVEWGGMAGIPLAGGGATAEFDLALLPWLALAGVPGRPGEPGGGSAMRGIVLCLGLALVPLGWGAGLDAVAAGDGVASWLGTHGARLGVGLALLLVFRAAASVGQQRGSRARRAAALGWLLLVPGWTALEIALRFAPMTGGDVSGGEAARRLLLSPLAWCGAGASSNAGFFGLAAAGVLLGLVVSLGDRAGAGGEG